MCGFIRCVTRISFVILLLLALLLAALALGLLFAPELLLKGLYWGGILFFALSALSIMGSLLFASVIKEKKE